MRAAALGTFGSAVLLFLLLPIAIVVPLSFSSGTYLAFPPPGWSTRWYHAFFTSAEWTGAALTSIEVGAAVTLLSVLLGTPAAVALHRARGFGPRAVQGLVMSPLIVPAIIVAIGAYFVYARYGLVGSPAALILAHTCLAVPFVVVNVGAALAGLDPRLVRAAESLGAGPLSAFRQVTLPLIAPGMAAGAVFAFITSFDELLVALFLSGSSAVTLPRRMFDEIRYDIDPTVAAASTLLIAGTTLLLLGAELLRRRSEARRTAPLTGDA